MEETLVKAYIKKKRKLFYHSSGIWYSNGSFNDEERHQNHNKKNAQLFLLMNEQLFSMFSFA